MCVIYMGNERMISPPLPLHDHGLALCRFFLWPRFHLYLCTRELEEVDDGHKGRGTGGVRGIFGAFALIIGRTLSTWKLHPAFEK